MSGEEEGVRKLVMHQQFSLHKPTFIDPRVKANVLLWAHFSRHTIRERLKGESQTDAICLLQAMADVISSSGWLNPALTAIDLKQMVTHNLWEWSLVLLQLAYFTKEIAKGCAENLGKPIKTIFYLVEMEDNEGRELLQMSHAQFMETAWVCKHFPKINCEHDVLDSYNIFTRETVTLQVTLEREMEGQQEVSLFDASHFPKPKEEGWWLSIGDRKSNHSAGYQLCITATKGETEVGFCSTNCFGKQTYTTHVQCMSGM